MLNKIKSLISRTVVCTDAPEIRKAKKLSITVPEVLKLNRDQIMTEWLWDRVSKVAFKVLCIDGHRCYKSLRGENIQSNFEYIQNYCELYTNQDK
jgi:hypothetical protein